MSPNTIASHSVPGCPVLSPDVPSSLLAQNESVRSTPRTGGQRTEILTFEAWIGGAGLRETIDDPIDAGQ